MIADMTACYVGNVPAVRVYVGAELAWEAATPKFTVAGNTFSPQIELVEGSTADVSWHDETGARVATGTAPTITWGTSGPHTVWLVCDDPGEIVTLNLGFHDQQDFGIYSLPTAYNKATQPVTAIENLQYLSGLRRFMAARTNGASPDGSLYSGPVMGGHLDFSGMTTLEYIECFQADVESVDLTGCASLIRLCVEQCDIATLDLNPVRDSLRDLRAAYMRDQTLTLAPLLGPMTALYHFCTRRQVLTGMPDVETMLPAVQQLWVWNNALSVATLPVRSEEPLHSVVLSTTSPGGTPNAISTLDLAGQTWASLGGVPPSIDAFGIGLTSVDFAGMGPVGRIDLSSNALGQNVVDGILDDVELWGTSNGRLNLHNNASPSPAGENSATLLRGRGWTVTYDVASSLLWEDDFETDSGDWEPGNGESDTTVTIGGGTLLWEGPNSYRRIWNGAGGALPANNNYEVRLGFTLASSGTGGAGSWWGVLGRFAGGNGVRALFRGDSTTLRIGNAFNATEGSDVDVSSTLPSGWDDAGSHELAMRMIGSEITVFYDGVVIATRSSAGLLYEGGVGICGQPQGREWDYVRVYSV